MKSHKGVRAKKSSFFSGKGFYIALAVSLVAVGGAAWLGLNSAINKLDSDNSIDTENIPSQIGMVEDEWGMPQKQVTVPKSDVTVEEKVLEEQKPEVTKEPEAPVKQGFIMPLSGKIIAPYSGDKVVKSKTLDEWVMHTGIDIKSPESTPVKAVSAGKVKSVYNDDMWGACVVIEHADSVESHYYNLKSAVNVKVNQQVKLGDVIGSVGKTAEIEQAEESHLHFGVKKNGAWVDPTTVIKS